jgi:uncharacterized protein YuzE
VRRDGAVIVYVTVRPGDWTVDRTDELAGSNEQVMVDYDADGSVLGIEFLDAQRITSEPVPSPLLPAPARPSPVDRS